MKRFYFDGQRGCGTYMLPAVIVSTDEFNAVIALHADGWHHLKLKAVWSLEK